MFELKYQQLLDLLNCAELFFFLLTHNFFLVSFLYSIMY